MKPRQILLCLVLSTLVDILVLPRDGLQCCFQYVNIKTTKRARRQARLPGKRVPRLDGVRQLAASTANGASADQGRLDDPMRKRRCTEERTPPRRGCRGRRREGPLSRGPCLAPREEDGVITQQRSKPPPPWMVCKWERPSEGQPARAHPA